MNGKMFGQHQNRSSRRTPLLRSGKVAGVVLTILALALALSPALATPAVAKGHTFPPLIPLPAGFAPEGIAVGYGHTFYVGSIPTGAIYMGDLRTGEGEILVHGQEGRQAIGLDFDERSGYLYVAGGPTGKGFVYDGETGALVAEYTFTDPMGTFINDVVVTGDAAYFTNSFMPYIYRAPLGPAGEPQGGFQAIELTGDFTQVGPIGTFNANGITATPNGKWLIIVNSTQGTLYRVDPKTGEAMEIDLGGDSVPAGDGILLHGHTLYVVQNQLNQIAKVELSPDYLSGEVVDIIMDPDFDIPTTIAMFGKYLYAVNARFGTPPAGAEYHVVQVPR